MILEYVSVITLINNLHILVEFESTIFVWKTISLPLTYDRQFSINYFK